MICSVFLCMHERMKKILIDKKLTDTVNNLVETGIKSGLIDPENADNVIESAESDPVTPEIVDDTVPVIIEPKTLSLVQQFSWNFEEMKANLTAHIQKYTGLVVTDQNLKSMEQTQKEIAGLRTRLGKFKKAVKDDLEKPVKVFENQLKELLNLIESVEKPIKDQLEVYETKRKNQERQKCQEIIRQVSADLGLEEQYSSQIVVDEKWLNRGAKKKEVKEAIQERVCWFLDIQAKDHQAELFAAQKEEMSKLLCQSLSAGLATPLTYEEIKSRIEPMTDILAVKAFIENEVAQRKERETRAAQLAVEQVKQKISAVPSMPASMPPMPPPVSVLNTAEETWDVALRLPGINLQQSIGFQKYLADAGIKYEVVSQQSSRKIGERL